MTKEKLLDELKDTWICLAESPIQGVGVFAIKDIPKGCRDMFLIGNDDFIEVDKEELSDVPLEVMELIDRYCIFDKTETGGKYWIPNYGFKIVDLVNYLNHSKRPNIVSINNGEYFEAIRDIKKGEELLIDYDEITDDAEENYH